MYDTPTIIMIIICILCALSNYITSFMQPFEPNFSVSVSVSTLACALLSSYSVYTMLYPSV